jgi:hypothetical protein
MISIFSILNDAQMTTSCRCAELPAELPEVGAKDFPELKENLMELSTDYLKWITLFQCKVCGQRWEEHYELPARGDVPSMRKLTK